MNAPEEKSNPFPVVESRIGMLYPTPFVRRAVSLVGLVESTKNSRIGWLKGDPGAGKTAASYYIEQVCGCYRICCSEGMNRLGIIRAIAETLGVGTIGTYDTVLTNVKKFLLEMEGATFVIDEADELNQRGLNALRFLADEAGAAIILCGSDILEQTFAHPRSGAYLNRMTSRIATKKIVLDKLTIPQLVKYVLEPVFGKVSEDAAKAFHKLSKGNWRHAADLVAACQDVLTHQNETKLTPQIINSAARTGA